jgi:sugar phosphate isomerase/epimerase
MSTKRNVCWPNGDSAWWPLAQAVARRLEAPIVVACVAPDLARLVASHADERVGLCVENHWDQPLATSADVREVLSLEPMLSACLDTGHALLAGEAPDAFARALGPRLRHVHLKEGRRPTILERSIGKRARRRFLPRPGPVHPGDGRLDISQLVRALGEIGYRGYVSVEHEGEEAASAVLELSRAWRSAGARSDGARHGA